MLRPHLNNLHLKSIFSGAVLAFLVIAHVVLLSPVMVHAQAAAKNPVASPTAPAAPPAGQTVTPDNDPASTGNHLFNPIKYQNLGDLIISVTKNFVGIIAILSVSFIVLGGAQMVISAGNTEAIEKARKTVTWAILGLVIALLAFSAVAIVENFFGVK